MRQGQALAVSCPQSHPKSDNDKIPKSQGLEGDLPCLPPLGLPYLSPDRQKTTNICPSRQLGAGNATL